jgi:hypothetical protein
MTMQNEDLTMSPAQYVESIAADVRSGAVVYLNVAGPTRGSDLVRVLCQHLQTRNEAAVWSVLMEMVDEDELGYSASAIFSLMSSPTGDGTRESEEQR